MTAQWLSRPRRFGTSEILLPAKPGADSAAAMNSIGFMAPLVH
jgi:hypothetical protein